MEKNIYPKGCPKCNSEETEYHDIYAYDNGKVAIDWECNHCDYQWTEHYGFEVWEPRFDEDEE